MLWEVWGGEDGRDWGSVGSTSQVGQGPGKGVPCGRCSGRKREITKILRSLGLLPLPETLQQNCPLFPEASRFRVCCVFMVTLGWYPP